MLEEKDRLFDTYSIISQIADIFVASTQTSTVAIQQTIAYLAKDKFALQQVREEVDGFVE